MIGRILRRKQTNNLTKTAVLQMTTPYHLLTAGCNSFPNVPGHDLRGCIADAHRMQETLVRAFGEPARYRILENPTRTEFVQALTTARDMARAGEVKYVDLAISTHGIIISDEKPDNFCTALVFSDASPNGTGLLPDWQLKEILDSFPRDCIVECWFDTCHSGTISRGVKFGLTNLPRSIPASIFTTQPPQRIRTGRGLKTLSRGAETGQGSNIVAWGACRDEEEAADAPDGNGEFCGAFTRAWCDVFTNNRKSSRWDLLPMVQDEIFHSGFQNQHPTLSAQRSNS